MSAAVDDAGTIADRIALEELFNRFADVLDRKEFEKLADFFTEGAVGEFKARDPRMQPMVITGRQDLIEFARRSIGSPEIVTQHPPGTFSARIDGDTAEESSRMRGYDAGQGREGFLFEESIGHYARTIRRTSEGWRCNWWKEEIYIMLGDPRLFVLEFDGSLSRRQPTDPTLTTAPMRPELRHEWVSVTRS